MDKNGVLEKIILLITGTAIIAIITSLALRDFGDLTVIWYVAGIAEGFLICHILEK
jgi:hypothetical protein